MERLKPLLLPYSRGQILLHSATVLHFELVWTDVAYDMDIHSITGCEQKPSGNTHDFSDYTLLTPCMESESFLRG